MGLPTGIQAVMQRLMQQGQTGGDFDSSQFPNIAPTPPGGGFGPPPMPAALGAAPDQGMGFGPIPAGPPVHPSNPYSQYASLPPDISTPEEQQLAATKAKGAEKHTGGFAARLKDALKAFGVNALQGLAQGNGLAALAGGVGSGIANLIHPQFIHNQMYAKELADQQQAATAARLLADQRMNQQMALGKYQQEGARIGLEGRKYDLEEATNRARAAQQDQEGAIRLAELYRQLGVPEPANLATRLGQPGLAGAVAKKEPQFITGPDGVLRHKETMQPVIAPETGQPMQAKQARQQGFTLGDDRYEYNPKTSQFEVVASKPPAEPQVSETTKNIQQIDPAERPENQAKAAKMYQDLASSFTKKHWTAQTVNPKNGKLMKNPDYDENYNPEGDQEFLSAWADLKNKTFGKPVERETSTTTTKSKGGSAASGGSSSRVVHGNWTALTDTQRQEAKSKYDKVKSQKGAREAFQAQWGVDPDLQ